MKRTEVHGITPDELDERTQRVLEEALRPVLEELREVRATQPVIPHTKAVAHFDDSITPRTIKEDYIRGARLPKGVDVPLPARKVGNRYFIEREMLFRWLLGECTEEDLYPWQLERAHVWKNDG